jgi:hypothetical protein
LTFSGSLAELPESFGGLPESERETGNSNRSEQREKAVVPVDESKRTDDLRMDQVSGDDAVLLGTFGGLLAG